MVTSNQNLLHRAAFVGAPASGNVLASDQTLSRARFLFFSFPKNASSPSRSLEFVTERGFLNFPFKPAETRQSVETGENATKENVSLPFSPMERSATEMLCSLYCIFVFSLFI